MSKKDNFSQAMYEMFGLGKSQDENDEELETLDSADAEEAAPVEDSTSEWPAESAVVESAPAYEEPVVKQPEPQPVAEAPQPVYEAPAPQPVAAPAPAPQPVVETVRTPVRRANCTYFAEGTSMEGTLRSDSDVEICGDFKGEIASDGKVTIHANTTSSIAAAELVLVGCTLTGDSMVGGDVTIDEHSSITGNVRAANIVCSGMIQGNLNVQNNIMLTENAQVIGDIKTGTLAMSRGAKVSGKVDMGN